jgi:transcriptional regulator with XRE-family HTH domain
MVVSKMNTTTTPPNPDAGRRLRRLRGRRGVSLLGLAVAAGASTQTIGAIERHGHVPQPGTRRRIARALGVEAAAIWPRVAP